jgi:hypothetical protein
MAKGILLIIRCTSTVMVNPNLYIVAEGYYIQSKSDDPRRLGLSRLKCSPQKIPFSLGSNGEEENNVFPMISNRSLCSLIFGLAVYGK